MGPEMVHNYFGGNTTQQRDIAPFKELPYSPTQPKNLTFISHPQSVPSRTPGEAASSLIFSRIPKAKTFRSCEGNEVAGSVLFSQ